MQEARFQLARERNGPQPPCVVEKMIEDVMDRISRRANLQHLSDPAGIGVIKIPAGRLPVGTAQNYLLKPAVVFPTV